MPYIIIYLFLPRRSYEAAKDELSGFRHNNLTLLTMQKTDLIEEDFFNPTSTSSTSTSSHTDSTTTASNSNAAGEGGEEGMSILDPKYIQKLIDEQQNKNKDKGTKGIKFKSAFTSSPIDNIKLPLYMSTPTFSTTTTAPSSTTTGTTVAAAGGEGSELSPPPRAKVDFLPTQYWLALLKKNFVRSRTLGQGDCESNSRQQ